MTEPQEVAGSAEQIADGVWHWRISNSNIGGATSSSHAVASDGGCVLIDPIRLDDEALASLPKPEAIVLDTKVHQRAAWRYRKDLGVEVWLPEGAPEADEEPDHRYSDGDSLPGGLRAVRTPGPEQAHYALLLERGPGVLFCADLFVHDGSGELQLVPADYHEDPAESRRSIERLLDLPFGILCLDHGPPLADDPKGALRRVLASSG